MRINLFRRRKGSLGLEAVAIVPFAIMMILLSRFILEAMLTRHEVAIYTRGSTASAAAAKTTSSMNCDFDKTAFTSRSGVTQSATISCKMQDGEAGLQKVDPFFDALQDGAAAWPEILRDVDQGDPINDILGNGNGSMAFDRPAFLETRDSGASKQAYLLPQDELWDHNDDPWKAAHDPVDWDELSKKNTYKLFPRVFPSRNN